MKKFFKWFAISFGSLLFLLLVAVGIVVWFVFTPEKLTPIVRTQAAKYITCHSEIGEVELTFFSTFPKFGLKVNHFVLINPTPNAQSDTLVSTEELVGVVDVAAWWKRNEIVLNELRLSNGTVNAFVDSLGHTNFDIVKPDTTTAPVDTTQSSMSFSYINIADVEMQNINLSYIDKSMKMESDVRHLTAQMSGSIASDSVLSHIDVSEGIVSVCYEGEKYLSNVAIKCDIPLQVILSKQRVQFSEAKASVNNMSVTFSGSVENDTLRKQIITDISYHCKSLPIPPALALIPPSFQSYLKGVTADGVVSSDGTIKGIYDDNTMPLMDLHFVVEEGTLKYAGFPLPLSDVKGDCVFYSDLNSDALSYFRINNFSANTPRSSFSTSGKITHLFSDIHCDLTSGADLVMAEFAQMIPANMKTTIKGRVSGQVKSSFSMSQVEKMQIERMKISGSVALSDFDVAYDSLSMKTDYSKIDFALPNPNKSSVNSRFVYAKVSTKNLAASKLNAYSAVISNALISLETSDVRDTTRIPNVTCSFALDALDASMDTIKVAVKKPAGQFTMLPLKGKALEPEIKLTYSCDNLDAKMGSGYARMDNVTLAADVMNEKVLPKINIEYSGENLDMAMAGNSAKINKLSMKADVVNDPSQKDIFQQWQVKGFLDMNKGVIAMSSMRYPLEIPSIKMNFDPQVFNIKESKLKIDNSDFSLSGSLNNVLSYFRKDSILRGNFNFVSNNTDVMQLMSLTSGIGEEATDSTTKKVAATNGASSGPFMVPKGVDLNLNVNINTATFSADTARGIKGDVRVKDGLLVLDGLVFRTPAARMQLTMMYRTPRKNHIFMGIDYHMMEVEIPTLLKMFPDIDTIMPMLRSFRGKGEFHMAVETYTDSLYNPKKSTLRGAASIAGQNLVLMDGQTFSEIAHVLQFSKKTNNKVDSLSAEFTIFKQEIDIYPFLIVMDKYKAVVAGQHNLDMSFNYHISIVDSPLPVKFGVDISGTLDKLKIRPAKCRYAELYRPVARGEVQNRQLELRRMVREALLQKVKKE